MPSKKLYAKVKTPRIKFFEDKDHQDSFEPSMKTRKVITVTRRTDCRHWYVNVDTGYNYHESWLRFLPKENK